MVSARSRAARKERWAGTLSSVRQARPSPGMRGENCCRGAVRVREYAVQGSCDDDGGAAVGAEAGSSNGARNGLAGRSGGRQAGLSQERMARWVHSRKLENRGLGCCFCCASRAVELPERWGGVRRGKADSGGEYQVIGRLGERRLVVFLLLTGHPTQALRPPSVRRLLGIVNPPS